MKIFARLVLTLLLTLPIYVGVTALPWLSHWFDNGNGWDIAAPIFRALGSYGGEEDEDYLYGSLLLISFSRVDQFSLDRWVGGPPPSSLIQEKRLSR